MRAPIDPRGGWHDGRMRLRPRWVGSTDTVPAGLAIVSPEAGLTDRNLTNNFAAAVLTVTAPPVSAPAPAPVTLPPVRPSA